MTRVEVGVNWGAKFRLGAAGMTIRASGRLAAREVVYDEAREGVTVDASD